MAKIDTFALLSDLNKTIQIDKEYQQAALRRPSEVHRIDPYSSREWVSRQQTFLQLQEEGGSPATLPYLLSWIRWLIDQRVNRKGLLVTATSRLQVKVQVQRPLAEEISLHELLRRSLSHANEAETNELLVAVQEIPDVHGSLAIALWERRHEVAYRLGLSHLDAMLSPLKDAQEHQRLAEQVLEKTEEVFHSGEKISSWAQAMMRASGVITGSERVPFPKNMTARTIVDMFQGEAGWMDIPELRWPELGENWCSASFTRAVRSFGWAWSEATAARDVLRPFAFHPGDYVRFRTGALLSSLLGEPLFVKRCFDWTRDEQRQAQREQAWIQLMNWRLLAAKVLLRPVLANGKRAEIREAAAEFFHRAWGTTYPVWLTMILPRLDQLDPSHLVAIGGARLLANSMREQFDEDWFRNPRAVEAIRHQHERMPPIEVPWEQAERGVEAQAHYLTSCLS
jgi:hypothetical protein